MAENNQTLFLNLNIDNDRFAFASSIKSAMSEEDNELYELNTRLNETLETIKKLTPGCDKVDYALSASAGVLCGVIDISLVDKPDEFPLVNIIDRWYANRTKDFAKPCCPSKDNGALSSAIKNLEEKFRVTFDQRGAGDTASEIVDLNPRKHHFKSLAHNPTFGAVFTLAATRREAG